MDKRTLVEFHPREVTQCAPCLIKAATRNAGCIEKHGAVAISHVGASLTLTAFKAVVHVPENHKLWPTPWSHLGEGKREIGIAPIAGGLLPVTTARICGI